MTITNEQIKAVENFVIENYGDSVAMQGDLPVVVEGEERTLRIYLEIREGEEIDNESIYDVSRILDTDLIG